MKKTAYILGSIEAILGLLILCCTSILNQLMPALGRVAYQAAAAGSYSPNNYEMSFTMPNAIAVVLIILGVGQILFFAFKHRGQ